MTFAALVAVGDSLHRVRRANARLARTVERHDGRIWAESTGPGQGAAFTFTLPVSPPEEGRGEKAEG